MLIGMGALAAGSAAGVGTGAFSSGSLDTRSVSVDVVGDEGASISLVNGGDPDVGYNSDGELELDLSGSEGEGGVNIDSRLTWGDHDNPSSDHAFKIVNNDDAGQYYALAMEYHFDDISWIDQRVGQSYIQFTLYDTDGTAGDYGKADSEDYPKQNGYNKDYPVTGPGDSTPVQSRKLAPGEEWYFVVDVDTTGEHASTDDKLSGDATIHLSDGDEPSIGGWNDGW